MDSMPSSLHVSAGIVERNAVFFCFVGYVPSGFQSLLNIDHETHCLNSLSLETFTPAECI